MMKKILSTLLAGCMLIGVVACGNGKTATTDTGAATSTDDPGQPTQNNTLDLSEFETISTYTNPVISSKTFGSDLGDPFVMRFNGKYYLYTTATGVNCWTSDDLVNWKQVGTVCYDKTITASAYAPEVYYYNGTFYMYTSPAGNGHYVLTSDSPTGPFKVATGNLGMSIDGSVFIDNDGRWYFYTAGGNNITAYQMTSPTTMTWYSDLSNASLDGWTEGPMVIYHDGYYYLTYTGNHYLCRTYRINYAVSSSTPRRFTVVEDGPLLVSTIDAIHSIGHSSTVKGPDLDSYYIAYHSVELDGSKRSVNIDRLVFNGTDLSVMGPTTVAQQVPSMPDLYAYLETNEVPEGWTLDGSLDSGNGYLYLTAGSSLLSDTALEGNYTAEFNTATISGGAKAGALFSYTDENNYGSIMFDPASQNVIITLTVDGSASVKEVSMIQSFSQDVKFDCIQSIQVERKGTTYTFYMNDRKLCSIESSLGGGKIGYRTEGGNASFGFIGGTNGVGGTGSADDYKSVTKVNGLIPANSYTVGNFDETVISKVNAVTVTQGNILNYRILTSNKGTYDLSACYFTDEGSGGMRIRVYVDGEAVTEFDLSDSTGLATGVQRGISLTKGQHNIAIEILSGSGGFTEFNLVFGNEAPSLSVDYDGSAGSPVYTDGSWTTRSGALVMPTSQSGKILYGDANWGDYTVEVDITPTKSVGCGVLVRTVNPGASNFRGSTATADQAASSTYWAQGYYVGLTTTSVVLGKLNYSYEALAKGSGSYEVGKTYHMTVVCEGATIQVYVDGTLCIEYTDKDPFLQGMVGLRTYSCGASFDNLIVRTNEES
ncbi:MAG: family 43 glycosylhydrolase [Eubacteriales bacterium]